MVAGPLPGAGPRGDGLGAPRAGPPARAAPDPGGTVSVRRPAVLRTEPRLPEIPFFPERLEVWLARAGAPPTLELILEVDVARLRVDFPDPEVPDDRRWWGSWDEAVLIGLAG